jgi:hypothetical protein
MSVSDMMAILDIQPSQACKWEVEDEEMDQDLYDLINSELREKTKIHDISVGIDDARYLLLSCSDGIHAIREEALKPIADDMEFLTLYTKDNEGHTVLEIMDEHECTIALICEAKLQYGDLARTFEKLATLLTLSQSNKRIKDQEKEE